MLLHDAYATIQDDLGNFHNKNTFKTNFSYVQKATHLKTIELHMTS